MNKYFFVVIKALLSFLSFFTKKESYILIDDLFEEDAECIDAYSLFLYMQNHNISSYYVVWEKSYFYEKLKREKRLKNIIVLKEQFGTDFIEKAFFPLLKTKIIISAFLNWGNYSEKRQRVQKWISDNKSITHVYLDHGVVLFKKDIINSYGPQYFHKLVVSNNIEKEIYQNKAGWSEENIIEAGLTRWDLLKREPHEQKNIFVFFTFRKTFHKRKDYKEFDYYKNIVSLFNNKKLEGILQQHNIKLIYGVHHALYNQSHLNWKISSRNIEIADVQNISKYIRTTDLFITDYSSIVFDFMFLDIPVIFYKLDFKDIHLHNVDKMSINNFNSCQKYIYNCTEDEDELIIKIKEYVDNGFKLEDDKRIQNDKFFYFKDNIAERLCAKLEKL